MFENNIDKGYLEDQNWWSNPNNPHAFRIANLDTDYPERYFEVAGVTNECIDNYVNYITQYCRDLVKEPKRLIVEFGSGGGWFLKKMNDYGLDVYGYEGSKAGIKKCVDSGVHYWLIEQSDFRKPMQLMGRKADMVLCTEVAEHLEPCFAGTLVYNLTLHSDLVWFSSEEPNTNKPHLHHPNEQPLQYWINIFDFYGYGCYMLPDEVYEKCLGRGRCIFYNKETIKI